MLNKYFKFAIIFDLIITTLLCSLCYFLIEAEIITGPKEEILMSTLSDVANVGFTSAGFVLTFLTLLVSFKSSLKPLKKGKSLEDTYSRVSIFNLFLSSPLYIETIRQLKNGVKVLILVAIVGYTLKICLNEEYLNFFFYYNIIGVCLISLVLWRSLLVLSGVLKVQNTNEHLE